ncbi:MAG TPA: type II secretion system F family protein [Tepidisphaeraceae bacterium]|jgi:type II secretory pathway component PulF|nr:type II secretion system F family protein [Tepidisphaeraceae bacterium]
METSFSYEAQTPDERPITGTIEAPDLPAATQRLEQLKLRVLQLKPSPKPPSPRPIRGDDFLAFNRQLAQLTSAGLPIEFGLRLIARDMRTGRLSSTINAVAADLESGLPLDQAFARHSSNFPPLYGQLLQAGAKSNNLPGMLLNLGQHLEMVQRLHALLWRACSYPLMVLIGLVAVIAFLAAFVFPQFASMFHDTKIPLPWITGLILTISTPVAIASVALLVLALLFAIAWRFIRPTSLGHRLVDTIGLHLPLIGGVLRWNLVARYCDALRLAVSAGLDLPTSLSLAEQAVSSPALSRDSAELRRMIESGQTLTGAFSIRLRVLPSTVPAAIGLASERYDLPSTLGNLSEMYQRQAELRMGSIPTILAPLILILVALFIGVVVLSIIAPLIALMHSFMR